MLDMKLFEKDPESLIKAISRRGEVPGIHEASRLVLERKNAISALQFLQEKRNAASDALKGASKEEIDAKRSELRDLSQLIKDKDLELKNLEADVEAILSSIPNVPREEVPDGTSEADNKVLRVVGTPREFPFSPKDHVALGEALGIIDLERAAKISGSRFAFLRGMGSRLNRALMQYMCDFHTSRGDTELSPPYLVREEAMYGVGQFPKFRQDVFEAPHGEKSLYLIPTAEVPLTNYFADEIVEEAQLPIRFCAYSPCFRSEAGAAGRDTRGMIRVHQFEKVEMVRFATPGQAVQEHEAMAERASQMLSELELPHRIVSLCTGDLGFQSEKTYDLEVWLPGQQAYREISSCSMFGTFQARRAKIRYRPHSEGAKAAKPELVVTLNGSGLPLGRTLVAILENHQQEDGSVRIPKILQPYMGGLQSISL